MRKLLLTLIFPVLCFSQTYTITVTPSDSGYIDLVPDTTEFSAGDTVEVVARPKVGYMFSAWGTDISGTSKVHRIVVDNDYTVSAEFVAWVTPIGIPEPPFGATETYRMYDTEGNRSGSLTYNSYSGGGYYTHFVDFTSGSDAGNDYGSEGSPRATVPSPVPAGAVVLCKGTNTSSLVRTVNGSETYPVFIIGVDGCEQQGSAVTFSGDYLVYEGFLLTGCYINPSSTSGPSHHAYRNNEIKEVESYCIFFYSSTSENNISNMVTFGNKLHNADDSYDTGTADNDDGGILENRWCDSMWHFENHIYYNNGGAINTAQYGYDTMDVHHIYYGRNVAHHNRQSSFACKVASYVIMSENTTFANYAAQPDNNGNGIVYQYGTNYIFILFNHIYESEAGITGQSEGGSPHDQAYIGNIIHDIYKAGSAFEQGAAIPYQGSSELHVVNNTIFRCRFGVKYKIINGWFNFNGNIVGDIYEGPGVQCVSSTTDFQCRNNLFYENSPDTVGIQWSTPIYNVTTINANDSVSGGTNAEGWAQFYDTTSNPPNLLFGETSPAIDLGGVDSIYNRFYEIFGIDIKRDIMRRYRPATVADWDAGAYEYDAADVPPTAPYSWINLGEGVFIDTGYLAGYYSCSTGTKLYGRLVLEDSSFSGGTWSGVDSTDNGTSHFGSLTVDTVVTKKYRLKYITAKQ